MARAVAVLVAPMLTLWRYTWAFPNTLLGGAVAAFALVGGGRFRFANGVLEVHGPILAWLLSRIPPRPAGALALTLGHVVLGHSAAALAISRSHEAVHVRQYERWGPFLIPAYLAASLFLAIRGRDAYRNNPFEQEAFTQSREA